MSIETKAAKDAAEKAKKLLKEIQEKNKLKETLKREVDMLKHIDKLGGKSSSLEHHIAQNVEKLEKMN